MNKYIFKKYDKNYKKLFQSEKIKLKKILGSLIDIEHIGSTSVPGLGGKGIIDILVSTARESIFSAKKKMEKAGYEFREVASTKSRLFFRRDYKRGGKIRRVHLHLVKFGGKDYAMAIGFRNYLIKYPEITKKYVLLKKDAVKKAKGDGKLYRKYKNGFIAKIVQKALKEFEK